MKLNIKIHDKEIKLRRRYLIGIILIISVILNIYLSYNNTKLKRAYQVIVGDVAVLETEINKIATILTKPKVYQFIRKQQVIY